MSSKMEGVKRTNLSFMGIDLLSIEGHEAVRHALDSGDLVRLGDVDNDKLETLPWILRYVFPATRFYSAEYHSMFVAFRSDKTKTYATSRAYLDEHFIPGTYDVSPYVKEAVDILLSEQDTIGGLCSKREAEKIMKENDEKLRAIYVRAIATRFLPPGEEIPDALLEHMSKTVGGIGDGVIPWNNSKGRTYAEKLYKWWYDMVVSKDDRLVEEHVPDVAHSAFPPHLFGHTILRELAKKPNEDIRTIMTNLVPTKQILRMCTKDTDLNGLVDEPIKAYKTLVMVDLEKAANETGNLGYVFGSGTTERRCAAEPALLEFMNAVLVELRARAAATS